MPSISLPVAAVLLLTSVGTGMAAGLLLAVEFFAGQSRVAGSIRRGIARVLTPKFVGSGMLLASLLGARLLATRLLDDIARGPDQQAVDLEDIPVTDQAGYTDRGNPISLFHFVIHTAEADVERFMQASEDQQRRVIRLADANPAANCFGWVFTGGAFGVRDADVPSILRDNGYARVSDPQDGDLVIYCNESRITHAGVAHLPDPHGPMLVESKWGPFGLYLHPPEKQPFSGVCQFFRSSRSGHLLPLGPVSAAAAE